MRKTFVVIVVIASVVAPVVPAGATVGRHCATMLVPLEQIGGVTSARLEPIGCFETYDQALEAGTGTALDVSSNVTPVTLTAEVAAEFSTTSGVLIGTEYNLFDFAGDSESYFAPTTCSSGVVWGVSHVGATWNDRFQSGRGFGGCDTNRKFEHENFGGNVRICTPNCADYGALANRVTSLRWRP